MPVFSELTRKSDKAPRTLTKYIPHDLCLQQDKLGPYLNMSISPFIQPIYSITTRKMAGAEVLMRFRDATGGHHSPEPVIETLEATCNMTAITSSLINEVCYHFGPAAHDLPSHFFLTFNITAQQLSDPLLKQSAMQFVNTFDNQLDLFLEIVERSSSDAVDAVSEEIRSLMDAGVHFAIDDLGNGSSTLKHLETLNFQLVKIDRGLSQIHQGKLIYRHTLAALVSLARNLGIKLIVEGIETSEQANLLKAAGVKLFQGYYFSRPMALSQFMMR